MFIALGIIYPVFFHWIGLGKIFLPMFWPLAAAGFFLPLSVCIAVGTLTPLLSFLISGMPPPPILYLMIVELSVLTVGVHLVHHRWHPGNFWAILSGLILSRFATLGMAWLIGPLLGLPPGLYAFKQIIEGLPGILAILLIIPLIVSKLTRTYLFRSQAPHV